MAPSTGTVRRLISLVAMLALVIGAMRFVRQPETANKLGRAFGLPHKSTSAARGEPVDFRGEGMDDDAAAASSLTEPPQATSSSSVRKEPTGDSIDWSAVKDNAPFHTEEHET